MSATRCSGRNYRNTVVYTVVATAIAMVLTTCYAYVLSKQHLKGRTFFIGIAVFTMFFNGGLIPNYVLITSSGCGTRSGRSCCPTRSACSTCW